MYEVEFPHYRKFYIKRSRLTGRQILAVLKQAEAGTAVPDLCQKRRISAAIFYKRRSRFGGMNVSLMTRIGVAPIRPDRLLPIAGRKLRMNSRRDFIRWALCGWLSLYSLLQVSITHLV